MIYLDEEKTLDESVVGGLLLGSLIGVLGDEALIVIKNFVKYFMSYKGMFETLENKICDAIKENKKYEEDIFIFKKAFGSKKAIEQLERQVELGNIAKNINDYFESNKLYNSIVDDNTRFVVTKNSNGKLVLKVNNRKSYDSSESVLSDESDDKKS